MGSKLTNLRGQMIELVGGTNNGEKYLYQGLVLSVSITPNSPVELDCPKEVTVKEEVYDLKFERQYRRDKTVPKYFLRESYEEKG